MSCLVLLSINLHICYISQSTLWFRFRLRFLSLVQLIIICWILSRWHIIIVIIFLGGLSLHLSHLIAWRLGICYRQFGTLPIGNFFVKFGLKTAWHISYDILWLLTYVNFWRLQGHLSTFAKIRGPQKIKVFSMKERSVVDEAWGF